MVAAWGYRSQQLVLIAAADRRRARGRDGAADPAAEFQVHPSPAASKAD